MSEPRACIIHEKSLNLLWTVVSQSFVRLMLACLLVRPLSLSLARSLNPFWRGFVSFSE